MTTTTDTTPIAFTAPRPVPGPVEDIYGDGEGCDTDTAWVHFAWTRDEMLGRERCSAPRLTFRPVLAGELCNA